MEENNAVPALPPPSGETTGGSANAQGKQSKPPIGLIVGAIVILAVIILAIVLLMRSDVDTTARIRDLFIIFMALESLVIGAVLIVLIVQLSILINLLQNEIKPIIQSTNDTVNTLRGTAVFISENLTQPLIRFNSYFAGMKQFFDLMRPGTKKR